jgi:hypothetical protein
MIWTSAKNLPVQSKPVDIKILTSSQLNLTSRTAKEQNKFKQTTLKYHRTRRSLLSFFLSSEQRRKFVDSPQKGKNIIPEQLHNPHNFEVKLITDK